MGELWACWIAYSRKYLKALEQKNKLVDSDSTIAELMAPVSTVLDMGCGAGYTTAALLEIFPNARVIGTNMADTVQFHIANKMADEYGFEVVSSPFDIVENVDFLFASEYFEHIADPIQHLVSVLEKLNPRYLYIANSFNGRAIGHFNNYPINGHTANGKQTGNYFNKVLKFKGYQKIKTRLWNNRPALWKRIGKPQGGYKYEFPVL